MVYMVVSALLFILVTFFLKKNNLIPVLYNSRKNLNLPPVVKSWPLVGPLYMLAKDPVNLIKKNYQKHGSVFTIKVLGRSVTLLIGPEVSRHFYTALDSEISQEELYKFSIPMFGPNVFFGAPMEIRQQQYLFLLQGLRPLMLRSYVNQIVAESQDYFSRWKYCGTVDIVQELDHLTTLTTARCLLGREVRANLNEEVSALIHNIAGGAHPIGMFFPYLPLPSHIRRDRARNKLNLIFKNIINSRKTSPQLEVDLLQTLLESRYKNGESNTNEQIIGILVVALFAGKFTTANTAIWTGAYLLQHKTYFSKALDEQMALLGRHGQEIDFDILTEMDVLHRCIKEAARIGSLLQYEFK
ncbi:hypothetical protein LUZ61_000327 [Rhynchospora tenuis]|uniref:Uncharacterized protein n=1 Tax=Rhynchospora tenuis TaxID=198213 RepID=A0AAD5ZET8_9POAL|nr:hypothetical protein LUZ61_000327 [Rhynchospora tenuis]